MSILWEPTTLNCRGTIVDLSNPIIMGILNVTEDSFSDGGRYVSIAAAEKHVGTMLDEGARIIDIGAISSRPGATALTEREEVDQIKEHLQNLVQVYPKTIFSVDTYRAHVAQLALDLGAQIINDISGFRMDHKLLGVLASESVPYILMHMQGTPQDMQVNPSYTNVTQEVLDFMIQRIEILRDHGLKDIIVDPGFGFGKSLDHNFQLLRELHTFAILERPLLVGISRKSMIQKSLNVKAKDSENGTTALHMIALQQGAKIIRTHQVKNAVQCIKLWQAVRDEPKERNSG